MNVLLSNCKQNIMSLSLLVGTTVSTAPVNKIECICFSVFHVDERAKNNSSKLISHRL